MVPRGKAGAWLAGSVALGLVAALLFSLPAREASAVAYTDPTKVVDLSGMWLFRPGDNMAFARHNLEDLRWLERRVPTDRTVWSERWAGYGWYRVHIQINEVVPDTNLMLAAGLAREAVEVYVNGALVASRGGFGARLRGGASLLPLTGIIPAGLLVPGDNVIAMRVYDPSYGCGLVAPPFLLGPPEAVEAQIAASQSWTVFVRVGLGLLAVFVCLAQLLSTSREHSTETPWLVGAGLALAVAHLAGTGVFAWLPSVDLKARIADIAVLVAVLSLGSFFANRYEDLGGRRVVIGQAVMLTTIASLVAIPASWLHFVASPMVFLTGLIVTLYSANLCAQAVRRNEPGSLPVFVGLGLLGLLIIYDGFVASTSDLLPPSAVMGAVLVLTVTAVVRARQLLQEHNRSIRHVHQLNQRFDGAPWRSLMDACVLPMTEPDLFLSTAIHEIARELQVRRCSMVLNHSDGLLRIRASVGLPTHVAHKVMEEDSISAYVFTTGQVVDSNNLTDSVAPTRHVQYNTDAFMCFPILIGNRAAGVLNVSDRNDGGDFAPSDAALLGELAHKLGMTFSLLQPGAFDVPAEPEPVAAVIRQPEAQPKAVEAKHAEAAAEASETSAAAEPSETSASAEASETSASAEAPETLPPPEASDEGEVQG